jgi:circadian clock protein KaiC
MLAALEVKVREFGARRIVFDAVDMVLTLLNDPFAERREIFRLHEWLLDHGLTAILTSKAGGQESNAVKLPQFGFMQFMVDCAVLLNQEVRHGVSQRSLRVVKYRGSSFAENESPFLIGSAGLEVAGAREFDRTDTPVTNERLSSGVARLDTMLGGGYYRAASILITGFPGTAKSTLSGAFAEAACERGERTLFVSFDSDANEVVRNLTSVNIRLEPHVKKGLLRLVSARGITGSAEVHLLQIKNLARAFGARCLVIDPISALAKVGNEGTAHSVAERLIDWTKAEGITVVCTSLLDEAAPNVEGTPLQVSTIADTWIHLNYLVHAGERNRGLSIIKSRGTAHSNQVRELVLSETGVTLADAYTAGGEVLMGTLRWEKERAMEAAREETELATERKRAVVEKEEAELISTMAVLEKALKAKRLEKQGLKTRTAGHVTDVARDAAVLRGMRGEDLA